MDTVLEIEHKINQYLMSSEDYSSRPFMLRMSLVGECPRLLDSKAKYGKVQDGPFALSISQIHRMERGQWAHSMWQSLLKKVYGDDFTDVEEELSLTLPCGYVMMGHNDGYFRSQDAIYELKTVADNTYSLVSTQDAPLPQHYEQATFYAGVKGAKKILLHYYNTAGGESKFFLIPFNQALFDSLVNKMNDRAMNIIYKTGSVADRPYHDPTCSPCWYCPLVSQCYENWTQEVAAMDTLYLTESRPLEIDQGKATAIEAMMELCISQRQVRLEATKNEESAKNEIAHEILEMNKNKVVTDRMTAEIKIGSKGNPLVTVREV